MFKLGIILLILSTVCGVLIPPKFCKWCRRDWLSTFPFGAGLVLILLSILTAAWQNLP